MDCGNSFTLMLRPRGRSLAEPTGTAQFYTEPIYSVTQTRRHTCCFCSFNLLRVSLSIFGAQDLLPVLDKAHVNLDL